MSEPRRAAAAAAVHKLAAAAPGLLLLPLEAYVTERAVILVPGRRPPSLARVTCIGIHPAADSSKLHAMIVN